MQFAVDEIRLSFSRIAHRPACATALDTILLLRGNSKWVDEVRRRDRNNRLFRTFASFGERDDGGRRGENSSRTARVLARDRAERAPASREV